eukprot:CAMPEP_0115299986 /NCGR_PEP_ID=MMETSP0270-20121206/69091_1 /TAXON_ID=71861 /ORGANISM="Scrippsiella trochoidea, Strain CCMP3099" /LENGTH=214 /DNA_ID=CAMNT_0002717781 /DNA_START=29 /DNA_END=670 /DNA_ORIENTATION=+
MSLVEAAVDAFFGAQFEIMIFTVLVCFHGLIFGGYRLVPPARGPKQAAKDFSPRGGSGQDDSPRQPLQPAGCAHSAFVRAASSSCRANQSQEEIRVQLSKQLELFAGGTESEALEAFLSAYGKPTTVKVLTAVRAVLQTQGLHPSMRLYELLLRGYLALRLLDDFSELLTEVEARGAVPPTIKVLTMRASVQASDCEAAIACLPGLASMLKSSS